MSAPQQQLGPIDIYLLNIEIRVDAIPFIFNAASSNSWKEVH